ncbi:MAG TPA: TonB family protein [Thermoanaerobaculia bacterium]|jgi:TonB family protein
MKRNVSGLVVVIFLGIVFFVLLGLLVFSGAKKDRPQQQSGAETLTVLAPRIRLRTEPNAKAPVVATAVAGEKLLLVEEHGAWVRVQDPDNLVGWTDRSSLERTVERDRRLARFAAIRKLPALAGVATERTSLYAGPGIFYPIVGELSEGTDVKVFTRDHDFYAIELSDSVAYADVDAINVTATGAPQLDVRTSATSTATETTETTATTGSEEATATEAPPPASIPAPQPVPARADRSGVYAAVPPGGTQPEEIDRVVPHYPMAARSAGVEGPVVIRGIVRRDGTIDNVEVIKDLPNGLGDAARHAVSQWRFRPATVSGEPIDVYYTVTVNFRLR